MKKILALILAMVMVLSLVACGAKEEAPATEQSWTDGSIQETWVTCAMQRCCMW